MSTQNLSERDGIRWFKFLENKAPRPIADPMMARDEVLKQLDKV